MNHSENTNFHPTGMENSLFNKKYMYQEGRENVLPVLQDNHQKVSRLSFMYKLFTK